MPVLGGLAAGAAVLFGKKQTVFLFGLALSEMMWYFVGKVTPWRAAGRGNGTR
jgi:hypothetical protein